LIGVEGPSQPERWVALEGAFNFRDLGGYVTGEPGRLRYGSVFRSDALHHLTPQDVRSVVSLGVDHVVDLRSPAEIASAGRGPLAEGPVEYVTASVLPSTNGEALGAPAGDDLAERYLWYLDIGREAFATTFEVLADARAGAVVFHCTAGKDRTGVVAALLLAALDVGVEDIAADYALTNQALPSILERLARDPVLGATIAQMPPGRRTVRSETMARFLELLSRHHGGARSWLLGAGVAPASIDALRAKLYRAP
jgi:protein-tyrosine phosphatase